MNNFPGELESNLLLLLQSNVLESHSCHHPGDCRRVATTMKSSCISITAGSYGLRMLGTMW